VSEGYDCLACGVCCVNPASNRAAGVTFWVKIAPNDRMLTRRDLVRKFVTVDRSGNAQLKMAHDGRCLALRGELGVEASCSIYRDRPGPCRSAQPGGEVCVNARRAAGLPILCRPPDVRATSGRRPGDVRAPASSRQLGLFLLCWIRRP
jgi:Fe-S-cluster containining protein